MRSSTPILVFLAMLLPSSLAPASADRESESITFQATVLSTTVIGLEPVISYAPNGTVWVAGTIEGRTLNQNGSLWFAANDTSTFTQDSDPPLFGGGDATVHHDHAGRLFWSEFNLTSTFDVAIRETNVWTITTLAAQGDRPWFRTNSTGFTFLVFKNTTVSPTHGGAEIRRYNPGASSWSLPFKFKDDIIMHDFINDTSDNLYVTLENGSSPSQFVVAKQAASSYDSPWSITPPFVAGDDTAGIARPAVDLAGNLYVVSSDKDTVQNVTSLSLRYFNGTAWTVRKLCVGNITCAFPAVAAGIAGRLGVGWYEANGTFLPGGAGDSTVWRYQYGLFDNATGLPTLREKVLVADRVHVGNLTFVDVADFSYLALRRGDALGRVAVAFSCNGENVLGCPASPAVPVFAVQTAGQGLYG